PRLGSAFLFNNDFLDASQTIRPPPQRPFGSLVFASGFAAASAPEEQLSSEEARCRLVHIDVEDPTHNMADGDFVITICMLADTGSSIPSKSQSRGSGSSRDTLMHGNPSGEAPIPFEAIRAAKGQSVEPSIGTSGGWKSEDIESISSQHTSKEATPSGERSTETIDYDMRVRKAQRQIADKMAQFNLEQVALAPIAADLRNTEDLENETRKALGGNVDSLPSLVSPESRKRRRDTMKITAASFARVAGLDLGQIYRWLLKATP
ncbi:MAG: hypothetical protein Q9210_004923, partial [Variospora velana]